MIFIRQSIKLIVVFFIVSLALNSAPVSAEVLERVVAIVDDEVVLLSEFEESIQLAKESGGRFSEEAVINQMINRIILIREARKFGLIRNSGNREDKNSIVEKFIDRRIKAFIHIPFDEIEHYYENNEFEGKEFYDVKDEIEKYLVSKELVKRLREYLKEQREKTYIRIQLRE